MAVVNGYATVQQLREQLDRAGDPGGKLPLALLERAINATSRAVDRHVSGGPVIRRRFWQDPSAVARTYRVEDPLVAWVDDISTKTGLEVRTDTGNGTFSDVWATSDYQLEPLNQDVVASGGTATAFAWWRIVAIGGRQFPIHPQRATLKVITQFGWSAIPDDVNTGSILKAAKLFLRKDSPDGWRGFSELGPVRISRFEDPDVADLLSPFLWDVAF